MLTIFVLNSDTQRLSPVHSGWACLLLNAGKAAMYRSDTRGVQHADPIPNGWDALA